jgi:hypothetical protein
MDLSVVSAFKKYYFGLIFLFFFFLRKPNKDENLLVLKCFRHFSKTLKTNSPQVDLGTHPDPALLCVSFLAKFSQLNKFVFSKMVTNKYVLFSCFLVARFRYFWKKSPDFSIRITGFIFIFFVRFFFQKNEILMGWKIFSPFFGF